jgi:hypothetical protein
VRYIELLGLPGAGKTTLLRGWNQSTGVLTVHQLVRRERLAAAARHRRTWIARRLPDAVKLRLLRGEEPEHYDAAAFIVEHREMHGLVSRSLETVVAHEDRVTAMWMMLEAWSRHSYARRFAGPHEGVILDEGIWQRLAWLLAVSGDGGPTSPLSLPGPLPQIDGLVLLDLPLDLAFARVRHRATEFQATGTLPAMAVQLERIVGHLRRHGVQVTVVDAQRPKQDMLVQLRAFLRSIHDEDRP